jgi:hypothetical protein
MILLPSPYLFYSDHTILFEADCRMKEKEGQNSRNFVRFGS